MFGISGKGAKNQSLINLGFLFSFPFFITSNLSSLSSKIFFLNYIFNFTHIKIKFTLIEKKDPLTINSDLRQSKSKPKKLRI